MAAVTGPGYGYPPPEGSRPRRRWLPVVVGVWGVVLVGAVFWSVRNDPPTVPEQRDVGQAVAVLQVAAGAVVAAAQDERWALSLGELQVEGCAITPVWDGQEASREVTVYVPEGDARAALDAVADRLPADYRAGVVAARGGTRLTFFADVGEQVGVEAEAHSDDQVLRLRVFTGCRPAVDDLDRSDPAAGDAPAVLDTVVAEITVSGAGGPSAGEAVARAVACSGGGTASTFVRDAGPATPESGPRGVPEGTVPVWAEEGGWAYRIGSESVVVTADRDRFRVSLTTACRVG
jgi:hypothetical protein